MRIKAGTFSITVSEGAECVVVDDETRSPTPSCASERANKTAIKEAFQREGLCVEGTHIERAVQLRIR